MPRKDRLNDWTSVTHSPDTPCMPYMLIYIKVVLGVNVGIYHTWIYIGVYG